MVERLLNLALIGGEPILYLLILLGTILIIVIFERLRFYFFKRSRFDQHALTVKLAELLDKGELEKAHSVMENVRGAEAEVIREGLEHFNKGIRVAGELMTSMAMQQQQLLDRRLTILGTIGSNAPFIGLLGTVLGIIRAFNDLAVDTQGGPSVVMAGIAEALVATAVGLTIAIPAVVFFNYFKSRQKKIMNDIQQIERHILAFIADNESESGSDDDQKS